MELPFLLLALGVETKEEFKTRLDLVHKSAMRVASVSEYNEIVGAVTDAIENAKDNGIINVHEKVEYLDMFQVRVDYVEETRTMGPVMVLEMYAKEANKDVVLGDSMFSYIDVNQIIMARSLAENFLKSSTAKALLNARLESAVITYNKTKGRNMSEAKGTARAIIEPLRYHPGISGPQMHKIRQYLEEKMK